jgi:hypothetical protein
MMWGGGENNKPVPFIGISPWGWYAVSTSNPDLADSAGGGLMVKMHNYLAGEYAYFIQRLASYPSASGSVLDDSAVVWGTMNGNSYNHDPQNTPFVVGGRLGGAPAPGQLD